MLATRITTAADRVADVVQAVVGAAGDAITDVVETAGNAVQDGLDVARVPWLGGVVAGFTNFAASLVKAAFAILSGAIGCLIRLLGGMFSLNVNLILKALIDIGSGSAGSLILIGGTLLSLIQRIFLLQSADRSLTKEERDMLRRVFSNSLALYNIRLIVGSSGAFGINDRAFTLGNTIYLKRDDPEVRHDVLVHECVHVWQYQNIGSRYTMDALGAQGVYGDAAYDWEAELARGRVVWTAFNKEAQAQLIQDLWRGGSVTVNGNLVTGRGCFFDAQQSGSGVVNGIGEFIFNGTNYSDLAIEAVRLLRGKINVRWSGGYRGQ